LAPAGTTPIGVVGSPDPTLPCAAAEDQAQDRIHRLGQTRPVSVFRYIVQDSIEERMLELQVRGAPPTLHMLRPACPAAQSATYQGLLLLHGGALAR